jgi:MFS family permease
MLRTRDVRMIITARALRTAGYGATSVLLAGMLIEDGCTPAQVSILVATAAAGSVLASLVIGAFADRWGRRRCLIISAGLMAASGIMFAACESYPMLLIAAFAGTISPSTNDNTPFSGVEQAILAQSSPDHQHTKVFTAYNLTALLAGSIGGLAAAALGHQHRVSPGDLAFALYAILAVGTLAAGARLSPAVEPNHAEGKTRPAPQIAEQERLPHRVRVLAGLFAIDAFAGGLAVQTMLAWWLAYQYGATTTQLGMLFFATNVMSAVSLLAAPVLARRHGLLATMLVPHVLANLLLLCLPLAQSLAVAATLLITRHAMSKVDVPARQAFVAAIVAPVHRTAAASLTSIARSVAVCASPMAATAILAAPALRGGSMLLIAGATAIGYDAGLWTAFRNQPARRKS